MKVPIVLAAFGTTTRAIQTYEQMDAVFKRRFPDHEFYWAYTSRMVRTRLNPDVAAHHQHPYEVLEALVADGHSWAVVQSLHMVCAHEFYRLVMEVDTPQIRTSMGLPLLCGVEDYQAMVNALRPLVDANSSEAAVLVGHGTDHPAWSAYTALQHLLQQRMGSKVWVGVVEEGYPDCDQIVQAVHSAGYRKVRLVPFMLVAGVHFKEDLAGEQDSWKTAFETAGIEVALEPNGLGYNPQIAELFCHHIAAAMDVIPNSGVYSSTGNGLCIHNYDRKTYFSSE